jgi:AbiV family abortive infection protein
MADATVSKTVELTLVWVRLPPSAPDFEPERTTIWRSIANGHQQLVPDWCREDRVAKGYRGKLTQEAAAEGIGCVLAQARELLADARTLFERERYSTALALAITAVEEAEKTTLLVQIATTDDERERGAHWTAFRRHDEKLQHSTEFLLDTASADFGTGSPSAEELATHMQRKKEDALYVDTLDGSTWRVGSVTSADADTRDFTREWLRYADGRVGVLEGIHWTVGQPGGWDVLGRMVAQADQGGAWTTVTASVSPDSGWRLHDLSRVQVGLPSGNDDRIIPNTYLSV